MKSNQFVWTKFNGEFYASKWLIDYEDQEVNPVASHDLTAEEWKLPINILARLYPPPREVKE